MSAGIIIRFSLTDFIVFQLMISIHQNCCKLTYRSFLVYAAKRGFSSFFYFFLSNFFKMSQITKRFGGVYEMTAIGIPVTYQLKKIL